ncbi:hypothetical protein SUGI_1042350 [Cryptomeria japonica]|nr:hypothetical protein SUGI_1042350 [Cryptomeria japonica]
MPQLQQFVAQMPKATLEEEAATGAAAAVASCRSHGLYFPTRHLFTKSREIPTSNHPFQLTARLLYWIYLLLAQ